MFTRVTPCALCVYFSLQIAESVVFRANWGGHEALKRQHHLLMEGRSVQEKHLPAIQEQAWNFEQEDDLNQDAL